MSVILSRGNQNTELRLVALMREYGITGWRRQGKLRIVETGSRKEKVLRVSVDFVFPKARLALFVDGCFWHCCPRHYRQPATRRAFWQNKIETNVARDRRVDRGLRRAGWKVLRIWECDLPRAVQARCVTRIRRALSLAEVRAERHHPTFLPRRNSAK